VKVNAALPQREKPGDIVRKPREVAGSGPERGGGGALGRHDGQTCNPWRGQCGGMSRDRLKRLKELEKGNARLRGELLNGRVFYSARKAQSLIER
jgi:hypothetical protein